MSDLSEVKVGDTLCIHSRWGKSLQQVQRITPTGRVITKAGTFKPDGRMMGSSGFDLTQARVANADDIAGINRSNLLHKCRHFNWEKLEAEELKAVGEIIAAHNARTGAQS